ncbi:MAG: copper amine oxidase N-terminal domain-containing protein [Anaerotignum sp.]|nr:copper amine oxidase N-terminal domain-containing protein [Anaerotignum sp.]
MKRLIGFTMAFILLTGTTAFAELKASRKELDVSEKTVRIDGEKIKISVEGGYHLLDYRYVPERKILIELPEGKSYNKEMLYFKISGESGTLWATEVEAKTEKLENGSVMGVSLGKSENGEILIETEIGYTRKLVEDGTEFSLWLCGEDSYKNNLLAGKEDILLRDDFVWMKDNTPKKTPTEVLLTAGQETIRFKGQEKHILAPIRRNAEGQIMVAAKDLGMVMQGAQTVGFNILWNKETRTVTLQMGARTISMSEGDHRWLYQGHEMHTETVPEIMKDGVMYLPLREMAQVFDYQTIEWNEMTQTVRLYKK